MNRKKSGKAVNNKNVIDKSVEDFSLDISGITNFFRKVKLPKSRVWLTLAILFVAVFLSVYFRSYSYNLPITDDWAYSNIYSSVQSQVTAQINQQYPNLPTANKNRLVNQQVNEFLSQQGPALDQQVQAISNSMKEKFQDDTGQTYLLAIDPYFYYRFARNILENGYMGDVLVNGVPYDNHGNAPFGGPINTKVLHPYVEVYLHKFLSIFTDNTLMKSVFFVPILLSALAVIPAFFLARKRVGYFGGFVAAVIVAIHPAFIGRSAGGFADTDAYNVLFPLLIAWVFIEAFESDNLKKQLLLLLSSGFLVGFYSIAWSGWWYIFDFLIEVVVFSAVYFLIKAYVKTKNFRKLWTKEVKDSLIVLSAFFVFSCLFVTLFYSFDAFLNAIKGPLTFTVIKQAAHANLWPNVYTTVAELNPASIPSIVGQIGGKFLFFLAGLGVLLSLMKKDNVKRNDYIILSVGIILYLLLITNNFLRFPTITYIIIYLLPLALGLLLLLKDKRDIDIKYALFLVIWFAGTIYASTKGTRFVLLMVPVFAIAFGISLGMIYGMLSTWINKEFKFNKQIVSVGLVILLSLLLINPIKAAHSTAKGEVPSMTDAWWESLTRIKDNSSSDAIITSWWDFGHWFKAVADRPVTFDGGSQNRPQAYWVGKLLMSDSEKESLAILRMLDCGGNTAFEKVDEKFGDTEISVDLVNNLIMMDRDDAYDYLLDQGFSSEEADEILEYSHCTPPEAFVITSGDMVGKAGVWAHFGSWDFDRAFIYNNVRRKGYEESVDLLMDRFGFTEEEAGRYYYEVQALTSDEEANSWIAPWPNYATGIKSCTNNNLTADCGIGINIGQSNQGQNVQISRAVINLSNPENSEFVLSFIDRNTGLPVAQQFSKPSGVVIAGETIDRYDTGSTDMQLDIVYDSVRNVALVSHPSLSQSMFTRLFYLQGRYTENFEMFSDLTSMTGTRIIVWKVDWSFLE